MGRRIRQNVQRSSELWQMDPSSNFLQLPCFIYLSWQKDIDVFALSGGPWSALICTEVFIVEEAVDNCLQIEWADSSFVCVGGGGLSKIKAWKVINIHVNIIL